MHELSLSDIWIDRTNRQRRELDVSDLLESIPIRGVLVPIIVTPQPGPNGEPYKLIAGERRITACTQLGLPTIPVRLLAELQPIEQRIVELEENYRRKDLTWQERCQAMRGIHDMLCEINGPAWTFRESSQTIGLDASVLGKYYRVAKELHRPVIAGMESFTRAFNFIERENERTAADAMSMLLSTGHELASQLTAPKTDPLLDMLLHEPAPPTPGSPTPQAPVARPQAPAARSSFAVLPADQSILHQSFTEWAPAYDGEPFNLIHCDFPYGVNVFGGQWSGRQNWSKYNDEADVYATLIRCLCENLDRLMAHSGHLVFWLSGDVRIQNQTLDMFAQMAPTLAFSTFPLVWLKSDNVGIVPDPKREPRRICETALFASREDRLLVKPVSNAISAPTNKENHPHTKPEPVLKHFLSMFVDRNTRMLDPTCGGGSSLRAAEALGAEHVLGLEIDEQYVGNARRALQNARVLRAASAIHKEH